METKSDISLNQELLMIKVRSSIVPSIVIIKMVTSVFFVSVYIEQGCSHTKLKITGHINKLV